MCRATSRSNRSRAPRLAQAAGDPQLQRLLHEMFRELIIDNPKFRETLDRQLTGPEAKHAMELAASRLEPSLRRIGDVILGTQAAGVTPEFAEVLRSEILDKDRRWFLLEVSEPAAEAGATVQKQELQVDVDRR